MRKYGLIVAASCLLTGALPLGTTAAADPASANLTPLALFNRCYTTITRQYLLPTHRLYAAVQNGTLAPVDACMQILSDAAFSSTPADGGEKAAVIQTFSDFHRTWFPAVDYATILNEDYFTTLWLVRDPTEPSLYVTRALFGDKIPYSTLVTEASGLLAQRSPGTPDPNISYPTNYGYLGLTQGWNLNLPFTYPGMITNITKTNDAPNYMGVQLEGAREFPHPFRFYQHMGGGILGSQAFLLLNFGRGFEPNDGGAKVPRRWSKAIFSNLMCRELPVLRVADAAPSADANAALPFRRNGTCLTCHLTADKMADSARNLMTMSLWQYGVTGSSAMASFPVSTAANPSYAEQSPDGKLLYRSFDGTLVDKKINGLAALGDAIAQQDDLYVCGAARYFEFFTGLHVNLQDSGDPAAPTLSSGDQLYRDQVIDLGRKFHQHQSIPTLIHDIISSPLYQQVSMRKPGTVD